MGIFFVHDIANNAIVHQVPIWMNIRFTHLKRWTILIVTTYLGSFQ
jgi:hypothetical protein